MSNAPSTISAGHDAEPVRSRLSPEQALTRLLDLIRTTRSVQDFTPEKLEEAFGLQVWRDGPDKYGFGQQTTQHWAYGGDVHRRTLNGMQFGFSFSSLPPGSSQEMIEVCQLDFDQFRAALETMGFSATPDYGEHSRHLGYIFDRPGMRIKVGIRGEADNPLEKIAHDCVEIVTIW